MQTPFYYISTDTTGTTSTDNTGNGSISNIVRKIPLLSNCLIETASPAFPLVNQFDKIVEK